MVSKDVLYLPSGDTALTVQFGTTISIALNNLVLGLRALVHDADINGVIATLPTYRSLLINYDPLVISQQDLITQLEPLVMRLDDSSSLPKNAGSKSWQIPICFDDEFSPDLGHVSDQLGMTSSEVIKTFLEAEFHVYMLGFAPGQPYMGGLPEAMSVPRRKDPIPQIAKGSLVTATGMAIIYPVANPTGWHVMGRTPVELFNIDRDPAIILSPGDKVHLTQINRAEYDDILNQTAHGIFDLARLEAS